MSRHIKCDRCGISQQHFLSDLPGEWFQTMSPSSGYYNMESKELCPACSRELAVFLRSLPTQRDNA